MVGTHSSGESKKTLEHILVNTARTACSCVERRTIDVDVTLMIVVTTVIGAAKSLDEDTKWVGSRNNASIVQHVKLLVEWFKQY